MGSMHNIFFFILYENVSWTHYPLPKPQIFLSMPSAFSCHPCKDHQWFHINWLIMILHFGDKILQYLFMIKTDKLDPKTNWLQTSGHRHWHFSFFFFTISQFEICMCLLFWHFLHAFCSHVWFPVWPDLKCRTSCLAAGGTGPIDCNGGHQLRIHKRRGRWLISSFPLCVVRGRFYMSTLKIQEQ